MLRYRAREGGNTNTRQRRRAGCEQLAQDWRRIRQVGKPRSLRKSCLNRKSSTIPVVNSPALAPPESPRPAMHGGTGTPSSTTRVPGLSRRLIRHVDGIPNHPLPLILPPKERAHAWLQLLRESQFRFQSPFPVLVPVASFSLLDFPILRSPLSPPATGT